MIIKKIKKNRGFVILFAVVLSSIILAIALGVANIALKEIKFGTSAKDANDAFFAADTGAECALYYDRFDNNAFSGSEITMSCAGNPVSNFSFDGIDTWSFSILNLCSTGKSCANVTVLKDDNFPTVTTLTSKGYNVADISDGKCVPISKSVERELEVTY